jgi:hypothetical protein
LPADVKLTSAGSHVRPGQTQHLAAAQAEDQDEDVSGIERILRCPGVLEE